MSAADLPSIGEIVTVETVTHRGEPGRVTDVAASQTGGRWPGRPRRYFVRLESVDGSLFGAIGWYEPHEFARSLAARPETAALEARHPEQSE